MDFDTSSFHFFMFISSCSFLHVHFFMFIFSSSFLICHFIVFRICHFSFLICHFIVFLICHFSFVICHLGFHKLLGSSELVSHHAQEFLTLLENVEIHQGNLHQGIILHVLQAVDVFLAKH